MDRLKLEEDVLNVVQGHPGALSICLALAKEDRGEAAISELARGGPKGYVLWSIYRDGAWTGSHDSFIDWILDREGNARTE